MIARLLEELKEKDIQLTFSNGKLTYYGPEENITPELIEKLKKNKGKLIKYFWPKELAMMMPINTEGSSIPLFIVHGDYANYAISNHLGPNQPVYGFFHHGSEGERIRFHSVKEMASAYLQQVLSVYPSGPFYLMGFSYGGTLAFEMAVQLQKQGYEVPILVLLDSLSPLAKEPLIKHNNPYLILRKDILGPLRRKLRDSFKMAVCEYYLLMKNPLPVDKRSDYIANVYMKLTRRYIASKYKGEILLFRTTENLCSREYLGWETLANSVRLVEIQGKHLEIFNDQWNRDLVQNEIEKLLAKVNSQLGG